MECRRVLWSKLLALTLAGLLLLNGFFFLYNEEWDYAEAYHEKVTELKSPEEGLQWAKDYQQKAWQAIALNRWDFDGVGQTLRLVAQDLEEQYTYLMHYEGYLKKIEANAKKLQSVSLFSAPEGYAYQNTVKTAADFARMQGVEVTVGHDKAVTSFFRDRWTDYSLLLFIFVVCGMLIAERKEGLWSLIYATPEGRAKLAVKRVGILFAAAWLGSLVLIGSKVLLCGWFYHGLGEWDRVLQSIPMFQNVPIPLTIGQFWLLYLSVKALGVFFVGAAVWAVLASITNPSLAFGAAGLLLGVEFACTAIPSASVFAILRYVNLFSYIEFDTVFTRYLNLDFFGTLISGSDLVLAILPPLCLAFALLNVAIGQLKRPVAAVNPLLGLLDGIRKKVNYTLAGGGEGVKLLFKSRGILVLLLLAAVALGWQAPPREEVPFAPFIHHAQCRFAGPITEETAQLLEAATEEAIDAGNSRGMDTVLEQVKKARDGAWIVPSAPYEAVWSDNLYNYHRSTALVALLFLVLLLHPIASQERQCQMLPLLHSTGGGKKGLLMKKQGLLVLLCTAVWLLVYGMELVHTVEVYGSFDCLQAPAYSLELFRKAGLSLPLGWLLAFYYGWKLLVLVAAGEICFFLSGRCEKNRTALLLCCGVILVPAALAAIGSGVGECLSLLLPLSGVELLYAFLV